jgi:hypothetical protein
MSKIIAFERKEDERLTDFGGNYGYTVGSKLNRSLTTTEVAARIRADIKDAVKRGVIRPGKYSVRSKYFSGGSSVDITIKDVDMLIWNAERIISDEANEPSYGEPLYTPWAQELLDNVKSIMNAYNYDRSDSQTDYFDVKFYGNVEFDWKWSDAQRRVAVETLTK